jgi:cytochrome c553
MPYPEGGTIAMRNRIRTACCRLLACVLATALSPALAGGKPASYPAIAGRCVGCHGADGIGKAPQYPNLQGRDAAYLAQQLKDFRSGARKSVWMAAMAKPLSDEEIAQLAAYFHAAN